MSLLILPLMAYLVFRFRFFRRAAAVTMFVVFIGLLGDAFLASEFYTSYIDPLSGTSETIEPLDYVASRQVQVPDDRILLVNFGNVNRSKIAEMIRAISSMKPKVIGLNAIFNCHRDLGDTVDCQVGQDTVANRKLAMAIQEAGNVVLASRFVWGEGAGDGPPEGLELSDEAFQRHAYHGFSNLPTTARTQSDVMAVRTFLPQVSLHDANFQAWSVVVANLFDSTKVGRLMERNAREEVINFRGNIDIRRLALAGGQEAVDPEFGGRYRAVEGRDFLTGAVHPDEVMGRIVLVGFMGDFLGDPSSDEKFFTPLNAQATGRANPDSFGLVVNANIISMILDEDYINEQPPWDAWIINFAFILAHVSILLLLKSRWPNLFDLYSTILIIIQIAFFSYLRIWVFEAWSYRLFFDVSIFTLAIAGIGINIYQEALPALRQWFGKRLGRPKESEVS